MGTKGLSHKSDSCRPVQILHFIFLFTNFSQIRFLSLLCNLLVISSIFNLKWRRQEGSLFGWKRFVKRQRRALFKMVSDTNHYDLNILVGLTAEYPATRTNFFVAGYAVRRNLLIQVELTSSWLATRYAETY